MKPNFYVIKLKRNFLPLIFLLFTVCLLLFSKSNLPAIKSGLALWANSVVPSLFPFFVATELLMHTNLISQLGIIFHRYMNPLFHVRGEGAFAFIMGMISGYPVGAKIVCNLESSGKISKAEAERLLAFSNNSGPLFIIGTVGISLLSDKNLGLLLLIIHIIASISVGILYSFWSPKTQNKINSNYKKQVYLNTANDSQHSINFRNLGEILSNSISSSIQSILLVGGFIVLFSVIISILKDSNIFSGFVYLDNFCNFPLYFSENFTSGILELTNGLQGISSISFENINLKIVSISFLLGFRWYFCFTSSI